MEVGQHDEGLCSLMRYRQLVLLLDQDVVDGRRTALDIDLCRCVEREKVRSLQVPADEQEPVDGPRQKAADTRPSRPGERKSAPSTHRPLLHLPVSRRRAKRSGSLALRIASCAPPMSYPTRRNSKVPSSTSQIP